MTTIIDYSSELKQTARKIATPGKGILAADESLGTINTKFVKIGIDNTSENRRAYRELLFGTPGIAQYISGIIFFDETLMEHKTEDGTKPLSSYCSEQDIVIGIKLDIGLKPLPGSNGESATMGLDGMAERCKKYYQAGARFAKWRAAYVIDCVNGKPSELVIKEQAWSLARYAAICQANGLCPIVEPEVMIDGNHNIETCARISERVWTEVFYALYQNNVMLEGILFKPNMITAGQNCSIKSGALEIAQYTIQTLQRTLPASVPGVTFLSGGQNEEEASINLDAINKLGKLMKNVPWNLSFSYGRALQHSCVMVWGGKERNVELAREIFLARAKQNSLASIGELDIGGSASVDAVESLFQSNYTY